MHAHAAGNLAGLPAPVPDELPGPPSAAKGTAVGAKQPWRGRAQRPGRVVAAAACQRTPDAAGGLLTRGWIGQGFADDEQSGRYRQWARQMVEGYVATLD